MHPLRRALTLWGALIALMWLLLIIDWVTPGRLIDYGVHPRTLDGLLPGVLAMPFLHVGIAHLFANSVPLAILGTVTALRDWKGMWTALAVTLVVSGLGVWLVSPAYTVTVGASGIVFGLFGYLLGRGVFLRKIADLLIALLVVAAYGSMIWGVFPSVPQVSWQGHLFGFAAGVGTAFLTARARTIAAATGAGA
ncbi:rhomboid family intramembrane serine protease [Glycomyces paridis]|uniref:Rhomboid family intramembrane serine protease n=2 Tax=Glycomyces paridis TaxID=2126555 RepID=A0A4S8P7T6_9ACTN|nr:rhomboid family intramembrane serine protease [Glycomyces paridis]